MVGNEGNLITQFMVYAYYAITGDLHTVISVLSAAIREAKG